MAQPFTAERLTKQMGRKALKRKEPDNTASMEAMLRRDPNREFAVCEACGNWAVIWPGNPYSGMHPMGCFDTPRGQRLAAEQRRTAKKIKNTASLFEE